MFHVEQRRRRWKDPLALGAKEKQKTGPWPLFHVEQSEDPGGEMKGNHLTKAI